MKFQFSLIVLLLLGLTSQAQMIVDNTITADQAVEDILLGEGVIISNITFSGEGYQIGSFNAENSNIDISSGVVIASGNVDLVVGPNDQGGFTLDGGNFGASDPDIETANPGFGFNDAAILEFDFIASGDSVKFNYIWSSEEYPEYVNSSFNDAFGFFLSGPGISGPYTNDGINIALVPGTNLPISIDNVNAGNDDNGCTNCEYYTINTNNTDPNGTQMDGFTVSLTAEAEVQCGEEYHIKIVVADAGDTILDSAVFLEAGSFSSSVAVSAGVDNAPPTLPPFTLLEGCVDGFFTVFRPNLNAADTLFLNYEGTVEDELDVLDLPDFIVFEEEALTFEIPVIALEDDLEEDLEELILSYQFENACGELDTVTAVLSILDYQEPVLDLPEEIFLCNGASQNVSAVPENGYAPFFYNWSTDETTPSIDVSSDTPAPVSVNVFDYCGSQVADSFTIAIPEPFLYLEEVDVCFGSSTSNLASGGANPYEYIYSEDSLTLNGNSFTPQYTGIFEVITIDACGESGTTILDVDVCETVIPNVFSPNGDNVNDFFIIQGNEAFPGSRLLVYNRWGQTVYESESYGNNWSAEDVSDGTYYYIYTRNDGEEWTGTVTVLRK